MIAEYRQKANAGIGSGLLMEVAGRGIMNRVGQSHGINLFTFFNPIALLGAVVIFIGVILFTWGCVYYCLGKGQSGWIGILGFFSCMGLILLVLLPDKYKDGRPPGGPTYGANPPGTWPPPPSGME